MKTTGTSKKRTVLLFFGTVMFMMFMLFFGKSMNAEAATAKATLKQSNITSVAGDNYCEMIIKNWNSNAKYTFSVSPKDSAVVAGFFEDTSAKNQTIVSVTLKKKGTIKVTVKETLNNKTRKVGTCTIKSQLAPDVSLPFELIEIEKGQTYNINDVLYTTTKDPVTYSMSNPQIATVDKYGMITAKKEGETTLKVKQGKASASAVIEVTSSSISSAQNKKYNQLKSKIEKLYKKKITAANYTYWYNEYCDLVKEWQKYYNYDKYLQVGGRYTIESCRQKFSDFMKTRTTNSMFGASLDAVKITKLTSDKVSLQLSKAVSKADMVNMLRGYKKYSKNTTADYTIVMFRTDGKYYYGYTFVASVKEGQKVITGKLVYAEKHKINSPEKSIKLKSVEKGKTYSYTLRSVKPSTSAMMKGSIKCR